MATGKGLDAVLLAEAPEAADLDRFYGERRHRSLFEFAARRGAGGAVTATRRCCAVAGGAEARSAAAARESSPREFARAAVLRARGALFFFVDWDAARVMRVPACALRLWRPSGASWLRAANESGLCDGLECFRR